MIRASPLLLRIRTQLTEETVQLLFILGIAFAIIAVTFALQNNSSVTVAVGFWNFDSSLAVSCCLPSDWVH